eukprot:1294768-Alexandrium_andersonii.AAC.1
MACPECAPASAAKGRLGCPRGPCIGDPMGMDHGPPCPLLLLPPYTCGAAGAPGRGGSTACPRDAARRAAS